MKLLLKIHNKERHSSTAASTAVTLFQRKRKYYHRRVSKSSSSPPLPANPQSCSHASGLLASSSSSASSAPGAEPSSASPSAQPFDGESSSTPGSASAFVSYRGESSNCPIERRPLLRNSPFQSSQGRSFASVSRSGRNNQNRGLPSNEPSTLRQERYFIYGALIFFAIVGFSTAIYFIVHQAQSADGMAQPRDILFGENYNPRTN